LKQDVKVIDGDDVEVVHDVEGFVVVGLSEREERSKAGGKQEVGESGDESKESQWAEDPAPAAEDLEDSVQLLDADLHGGAEDWSDVCSGVHAVSSEHMMHHVELTRHENSTHPHLVTAVVLPGDSRALPNYAGLALQPAAHALEWSRLPANLDSVLRGSRVAVMDGYLDR
jgi:hypothetical protein